ncbi:hypothetical protein FIU86_09610 [Roseovarius sp. THAF9]|uniref:porin n=1 Tax=Roseovarius sp. THAF9 TaxID=2587847 RepID=UPI0012AA9F1E|nr:porin [Roseovarius sp. THAF9]QFT93100.1 hypothetical protein FIU86_09610 [Roseovarius sp. THAF9]
MTYSYGTLVGAVVVCLPAGLLAQEFRGVGTLGYAHSSVSNGGGDISSFTLDGAGSVSFDSGVHLGFDGTIAKIDPDGAGDLDTMDLGLTLNYQFNNGAVVGGYLDHASLDPTGAGSLDVTSYGLSGGYVTNQFGIELFLGESETSPSLPAGADWTDYGVNIRYAASEQFRVGGHYINSELSGGGGSVDIAAWGLGASYSFANGLSGFAGVNHLDISNVNADATTYGIGAGYSLDQVMSTSAMLSLELARTDVSLGAGSADVDTVRLGVTVPLVGANAEPPLNSVSRSVMSPRHNAVSTGLDAAF